MAKSKGNKFGFLQSNFDSETPTDQPEQLEPEMPTITPTADLPASTVDQPTTPKRRKRKATGKRSNPNYEQIGVYIPIEVIDQVREKLFYRKDLDLSDLTAELYRKWLSEQ